MACSENPASSCSRRAQIPSREPSLPNKIHKDTETTPIRLTSEKNHYAEEPPGEKKKKQEVSDSEHHIKIYNAEDLL